ncbi:hypothetical protein AZ78_4021 [Lysobacter capsici AZ78]|uniref:Uncharacterized protein n=1 Tax=Lysobacter capsici AZ78 TaxID=1444315 RepID=A0A108UCM3_9GAMM|nr:hypothetical protein [Lysobacter capsici]KWS06465.1 hypothetical protein AZ78_4021 [Lysobacter capsici AZ78]
MFSWQRLEAGFGLKRPAAAPRPSGAGALHVALRNSPAARGIRSRSKSFTSRAAVTPAKARTSRYRHYSPGALRNAH